MVARGRAGRRVAFTIVAVVLATAAVVALVSLLLAPYLSARLSAAVGLPVHVGWVTWNPLASRIVLHRMTLALESGTPPVATMRAVVGTLTYDILAVESDGNGYTTRLQCQIVKATA